MGVNLFIRKSQLQDIFSVLKKEWKIVAPVYYEGILRYEQVEKFEDIGLKLSDYQDSRYYRIEKGEKLFSYSKPANSPKQFLHPPEFTILKIKKVNGKLEFFEELSEEKIAFFGIPPCDVNGIMKLDDVFLKKNNHPDLYYLKKRENTFIVAVTCQNPVNTCFCTSVGLDVTLKDGYDILLTELSEGFLVEIGSDAGKEVMKYIYSKKAEDTHFKEKENILSKVREKIKKAFSGTEFKDKLYQKIDSDFWNKFNKTCLSCTACTQVCPTCFCFDIVERNNVAEGVSERISVWDSCFNQSFATVHRFNIRGSVGSRYRQWLLHKFAYWEDQFETLGCVGCGRCVTWCPAGIDIRKELNELIEG